MQLSGSHPKSSRDKIIRFLSRASRLAAQFTEAFSTLVGPWQPPLDETLQELSILILQNAVQNYERVHTSTFCSFTINALLKQKFCTFRSTSLHQVYTQWHQDRREKKNLCSVLCHNFPMHHMQLLIIPSLTYYSNISSLKKTHTHKNWSCVHQTLSKGSTLIMTILGFTF